MNYNEARKMFEKVREDTIQEATAVCINEYIANPDKIIYAKTLAECMNCTQALLTCNLIGTVFHKGSWYHINPTKHVEYITYVNPLDPKDTVCIQRRRAKFNITPLKPKN